MCRLRRHGHKNRPRAGTAHMGKNFIGGAFACFVVGRLLMKFYAGPSLPLARKPRPRQIRSL